MSENGNFQLGTFSVRPGEKASGFLSVADGEFQLPVTILNGEEPGKTVLITAGIHAEEYVGIQAAVELADRLKTEKIAGTVVIVKVINREAFENRSGTGYFLETGREPRWSGWPGESKRNFFL